MDQKDRSDRGVRVRLDDWYWGLECDVERFLGERRSAREWINKPNIIAKDYKLKRRFSRRIGHKWFGGIDRNHAASSTYDWLVSVV